MRVFDESKTTKLTEYDLSVGYLKPDKLFIAHHEAQEAVEGQFHYETIKEYPNGGKDVKKVWDVEPQEAREAWDEYEDIQVYIPYTQAQINARLRIRDIIMLISDLIMPRALNLGFSLKDRIVKSKFIWIVRMANCWVRLPYLMSRSGRLFRWNC